jgi:transcriptional regulator with XRE-family HTH domain
MVGKSEDWLSKIERGERQARRLDVLADLARELRVTLGISWANRFSPRTRSGTTTCRRSVTC